MKAPNLYRQVEIACMRLLSEQNRDPYTPTYGCYDRRYWGWKLVDYPEATFQRNVYPLAWWLANAEHSQEEVDVLRAAIRAGLEFAIQIQHRDGSFDQAFPHEHSYGATAFLLHPLLKAYQTIQTFIPPKAQDKIEAGLQRSANFLTRQDEKHGHIANHLAGAVLSLLLSADQFSEPRYRRRADELLETILSHQSTEGWFLEYEGADPGYQTLCMYYLAQVYQLQPEPKLREALERSIHFLAWFIHPDGTFGGEYGSRRTAIFYPGGIALLSPEFPLAQQMTRFMLNKSIPGGSTISLNEVDLGNFAPLLSNYVLALEALPSDETEPLPGLPWEQDYSCANFPEAGLFIRGKGKFYSVIGTNNGGVLKVFDRQQCKLLWSDGGYVGQLESGAYITTQITEKRRPNTITDEEIQLETRFYHMLRSVPTPFQFIILRVFGLTLFRNLQLGNWVKRILVERLISGKRPVGLKLTRTVKFQTNQIEIADLLQAGNHTKLRWLRHGITFVAIHMASARYFENFSSASLGTKPCVLPVDRLNQTGKLKHEEHL